MIPTNKPTGALSEKLVRFLVKTPSYYLVVDKDSNQWGVAESVFNDLVQKGYPIKEVRRK